MKTFCFIIFDALKFAPKIGLQRQDFSRPLYSINRNVFLEIR